MVSRCRLTMLVHWDSASGGRASGHIILNTVLVDEAKPRRPVQVHLVGAGQAENQVYLPGYTRPYTHADVYLAGACRAAGRPRGPHAKGGPGPDRLVSPMARLVCLINETRLDSVSTRLNNHPVS